MKLHIKNMVCDRCIMVVESELKKLGFFPVSVSLGEVQLEKKIDDNDRQKINSALIQLGFELIDDKKNQLTEQIKNQIVQLVHYTDEPLRVNLSDYLTAHIQHDYNYMSNLFSEEEGITIEKYFIAQKIERVKELLTYGELNLNEIALKLNYSSAAHLSSQFKKIVGVTPSQFKQATDKDRKPLDKV